MYNISDAIGQHNRETIVRESLKISKE